MANKSKPASASNGPKVVVRTCPLFDETASAYFTQNRALAGKISEFYKSKIENPLVAHGSSDAPFRSDGNLGGFRHAHLTQDLSLVYRVQGANPICVDLYGIFSHADLGTGQPAKINRQKSAAKRMSGQVFK